MSCEKDDGINSSARRIRDAEAWLCFLHFKGVIGCSYKTGSWPLAFSFLSIVLCILLFLDGLTWNHSFCHFLPLHQSQVRETSEKRESKRVNSKAKKMYMQSTERNCSKKKRTRKRISSYVLVLAFSFVEVHASLISCSLTLKIRLHDISLLHVYTLWVCFSVRHFLLWWRV